MTSTESSSVSEGLQAHGQEARLLVELLRTSRLALLYGQVGSDKTALLQHDLMPLMRRSTVDQAASALVREMRVVVPFQDRRSLDAVRASKHRREIIVYFDAWTDAPLAALRARIHQAAAVPSPTQTAPPASLRDTLDSLSGMLNATIIILLDRFEQLLKSPADRPGSTEFTDELVEAINDASLAANFLIALDEEASPKLASLRIRIPGFDDFSLKLSGSPSPAPVAPTTRTLAPPCPDGIGPLPVLIQVVADLNAVVAPPTLSSGTASKRPAAATSKARLPPPPRAVIRTDDVYALIQATLARTATQGMDETAAPAGSAIDALRTRPEVTPAQAPVRRSLGPRPARSARSSPRRQLPDAPTKPAGEVASKGRAARPGITLKQMVRWVARRLLRKPGA